MFLKEWSDVFLKDWGLGCCDLCWISVIVENRAGDYGVGFGGPEILSCVAVMKARFGILLRYDIYFLAYFYLLFHFLCSLRLVFIQKIAMFIFVLYFILYNAMQCDL